jgi:hypothetical protein
MTTRSCARALLLSGLLLLWGACSDDNQSKKPQPWTVDTGRLADTGGSRDATAADDTAPVFVGVTRCETDSDCDDSRECTADTCVDSEGEGRICSWTQMPDTCLIDGVCFSPSDTDPRNSCQICDANAPTAWTTVADGTECDDENICTVDTFCSSGACEGAAVDCDDGNACTVASCAPEVGCINDPVDNGTICDDADLCTETDQCLNGVCSGQTLSCDDQDPCTDDSCGAATGCVHTDNTASCEDGDPCTINDVCTQGQCQSGDTDSCDDFNPCTIDICHQTAGCQHLATNNPCCTGVVSICDDSDPCTTDLCDPVTAGCSYQDNTAPCDDQDACTENDACSVGQCVGSTKDCSDGNACTADQCNINQGCFWTAQDGTVCDDGLACSTGDVCAMGACVADTSMCLCTPTLTDGAKVITLELGANENPGEALDIDGDGSLDNALAPLGAFLNTPLSESLDQGDLMLLFEYIGFAPGSFTLALHNAELDSANAMCAFQTTTCNYLADRSTLDPLTCAPTTTLSATRTGNLVTAGSPTATVPIAIPLDSMNVFTVTLYKAHIEMTVSVVNGEVVSFTAILGGAATESDLNTAISSLDPASLPLPPANLVMLLATLAPNDVDTDGDGTNDAKSIGLKVTGIDGVFTGATTP